MSVEVRVGFRLLDSRRVIHHSIDVLLVGAGVAWVAVEHFADDIRAGSNFEWREECLVDLLGAVEADTVDCYDELVLCISAIESVRVFTGVICNHLGDP